MKQLVAVILWMGMALTAHAEFTKYFEDDDTVAYLDRDSISRAGREARLWTIDDYRKPQNDLEGKKPYLSVKSQWVFDCTKRLSDVLIAFYYSEPMARGDEVYSGAADQRSWDKVAPGSVGELAFKTACAKQAPARPADKTRTP